MGDAKALLRSLFETVVAAAAPATCMQTWLPRRPERPVVVGTGNTVCCVTPDTIWLANNAATNPIECQQNNDTYAFFESTGSLLVTGATKTNVNGFHAILIEAA